MKYKLYTDKQYDNTTKQILCGRGLEENLVDVWLKGDESNINNWKLFGEDDMVKAICLIENTIQSNEDILVIVDSDADGFCSAAIFINYLYNLNEDYVKNHVHYFLHSGKQHGLGDVSDNYYENINVVVCPDSSSNDYEEHKKLYNKNISVLVLDHHIAPYKSDYAITINNQLCDYPNKDFSGAGVTWQFCKAYDDVFGTSYADNLIDMCALGNLSDMMEYKSLETRSIVKKGLNNINNPFFYYMTEKNKYSIDKMGGINYFSMAFYVTPFINAIVRSGTSEEKELIFKSMLLSYAFEKIESGKRGAKGQLVPLVEEAIRIATNVKSRQGKLQDEAMNIFRKRISEQELDKNPVILIKCEPGEVEPNIAGLCANKIQAQYQRPTLLLTKVYDSERKGYSYRGSGRNYSMSEIQDFRGLCEKTGIVEHATGHSGAFGLGLQEEKVNDFLKLIYKEYAGVPQEPVYYVDYIWNQNTLSAKTILDIANMRDYWATGIPESYICIENIPTDRVQISLLSADKNPTLKITLSNGISIIKFKSSQEEYEKFIKPNMNLTIVGKPNKNEWNGSITPQIIVEDFELHEEWIF